MSGKCEAAGLALLEASLGHSGPWLRRRGGSSQRDGGI